MARRGRHRAEKKASLAKELPVLVVVALLLALLIKTFLAQAFFIPSGSMQNTLQIKDRVIVDKLSPRLGKTIRRGQIVVFRDPGDWLGSEAPTPAPKSTVTRWIKKGMVFVGLLPSDSERDLIKRVIGVAGDEVRCCDEKGRVTVNGAPLTEPYLYPNNPPSIQQFSVKVPKGRLWVMGDHRSASADSRYHMGEPGRGTIPVGDVVGPAFVVLWPAEHANWLRVPRTFTLAKATRAAESPPALAGVAGTAPLVVLRRVRRRRQRRVSNHG